MVWLVATALALLQGGAPAGPPQDAPPPAPQEGTPPPAKPEDATPPKQEEKPARSAALEELLRRLSQERGAPSLVPPNPNAPLPGSEGPDHVAPAQPALLRRASDPVQIALADGKRRDLQFWDSRLEISTDDEIRQGPGSCVLVDFADGARLRVDGGAIWRLESEINADPRLFRFTQLDRSLEIHLGHVELDTVFTLPGGNELASRGAHLVVRTYEERSLEIRNSGPEPAVVRSPYLGPRIVTLEPGQRVFLPVLPEPAAFVSHLSHDVSVFDDLRGRLIVQAPEQITLSPAADSVELAAKGPVAGVARACGARLVIAPGGTMRITRAPIGTPRQPERGD